MSPAGRPKEKTVWPVFASIVMKGGRLRGFIMRSYMYTIVGHISQVVGGRGVTCVRVCHYGRS